MKLEPVVGWVTAHALITKVQGSIVLPNASKGITRCYLLEEVSTEAEAAGYKRGDLVVAKAVYDMFFKAGAYHRVTFSKDEIICRVHGVPLSEFVDVSGKELSEEVRSIQHQQAAS